MEKEVEIKKMFDKLKQHVGKIVHVKNWYSGMIEKHDGILYRVNDLGPHGSVWVNADGPRFIGPNSAIISITSETGEVLYYNPYIDDEKGKYYCCSGHFTEEDKKVMVSVTRQMFGDRAANEKERELKEWEERRREREEERKKEKEREADHERREKLIAEKVKENRLHNDHSITPQKVIDGLKFIAENPRMVQEELVDGLLQLGCNFSLADVNGKFKKVGTIDEGLEKGDIGTGADVIVQVRDSFIARAMAYTTWMDADDDKSIYNCIRILSNDSDYTKDNIAGKRKK